MKKIVFLIAFSFSLSLLNAASPTQRNVEDSVPSISGRKDKTAQITAVVAKSAECDDEACDLSEADQSNQIDSFVKIHDKPTSAISPAPLVGSAVVLTPPTETADSITDISARTFSKQPKQAESSFSSEVFSLSFPSLSSVEETSFSTLDSIEALNNLPIVDHEKSLEIHEAIVKKAIARAAENAEDVQAIITQEYVTTFIQMCCKTSGNIFTLKYRLLGNEIRTQKKEGKKVVRKDLSHERTTSEDDRKEFASFSPTNIYLPPIYFFLLQIAMDKNGRDLLLSLITQYAKNNALPKIAFCLGTKSTFFPNEINNDGSKEMINLISLELEEHSFFSYVLGPKFDIKYFPKSASIFHELTHLLHNIESSQDQNIRKHELSAIEKVFTSKSGHGISVMKTAKSNILDLALLEVEEIQERLHLEYGNDEEFYTSSLAKV